MEETTQVKVPVQIVSYKERKIEERDYIVIEGVSEIGIFEQWVKAELSEKISEDHANYNLIFEPRKVKSKIGWSIVDIEKLD